ncbi:MAG: LysR substrate-binding domain-containing protein [Kiloniellaceae bacterium]
MRLPPLNALRAFESAARHGGFSGAAEELCVTRGAVSRHVKRLEEHLGVALFRRLPQGIELTEAGRRFLPILTGAFETIGRGAREVASGGKDLRIICPPTLSIRWLIPRLDDFHASYPEINVRLTTALYTWEDFVSGEFDLGIGCPAEGRQPAGIEDLPLFPMVIVPACAPSLLKGPTPLKQPADLARFTLLHESAGHLDWTTWLTAFGVQGIDPQSGVLLPNLDMAVKAAVMGKGVVMGDLVLTREEFDSGLLVMPFGNMLCETDYGDFALRGPTRCWRDPKVEAFKSWFVAAAVDDAENCARQMRSVSKA